MTKPRRLCAAIISFTAILAATSPAAHADVASLKKLLAEANAKREQVLPTAPLTQKEIEQLITAVPKIQAALEQLDPPEPDQQQRRKLGVAAMRGRPNSAQAKLLGGTETGAALDTEASKLDYSDYAHYADRADAVMKVLSAESWILAARDIGREEKAAPIPNLWLHIHDPQVDPAERDKLSSQLDQMLEKMRSRRQDAELVYANIDAMRRLFQPED